MLPYPSVMLVSAGGRSLVVIPGPIRAKGGAVPGSGEEVEMRSSVPASALIR